MKSFSVSQQDKDVLKAICEQSPDGVTIEQVRGAIRVIDAIEAAGETLTLEDADYAFMKAKFTQTKFIKSERFILELYDRIASAK